MKLKLHSRIKIAVEFSDVGVIKPGGTFEVSEERGKQLMQLGFAEPAEMSKAGSRQRQSAAAVGKLITDN